MPTALTKQTGQMKASVFRTARDVEKRLTQFGEEAVRMKGAVSETIEDRMKMGKRAVKHAYRATEDFVDDTTHRIKRDPLRAVGLSFVAGAAAGWFLPHRTRG